MYSREHAGQILEFGHEGVLYRNSFVMYDTQTRSLWVHTTGQAIKGELRGEELSFLPSEVVTWKTWLERHPATLVLDRGGEDTGFMGTFSLTDEIEDFGFSVGSGTEATLYPVSTMEREGLLHHEEQIAVYFKGSESFRAFAREGRSLQLGEGNELLDGDGARWDAMTGESLNSDGMPLFRLPATPWLVRRWNKFYPGSDVVETVH